MKLFEVKQKQHCSSADREGGSDRMKIIEEINNLFYFLTSKKTAAEISRNSGYGKNESYIMEQMGNICEILNVLHLPEFGRMD